jgi:hypothetical protein
LNVTFTPYSKLEEIQAPKEFPYSTDSEVIGHVKCVPVKDKTSCTKLKTYDKIFKSTVLPSIISEDMLYTRVAAFGKVTKPFPEDILKEVENEMFDYFLPIIPELKVWNDHEILNGDTYYPGIDLSTSLGFPWNMEKLSEGGKKDVFKNTDGLIEWKTSSLATAVRFYCVKLCQEAKKDNRLLTVFSCQLKDETRPIEKVIDKPKTRIFEACAIEMTYLTKMILGSFFNCYLGDMRESSHKLRMNPHSLSWDIMYHDALSKGQYGFDGDFENFDSSQKEDVMSSVFNVIRRLYVQAGFSPREINMLNIVEANIIKSVMVANGFLLMKETGNPSGWPGTTPFNSLVNEFIMLIVYKILVKKMITIIQVEQTTFRITI